MMPTKQTKIPTIGNTIHNVLLVPAASNAHSGWLAASIAAQMHRAGIATAMRRTSVRTITAPAVSHAASLFWEPRLPVVWLRPRLTAGRGEHKRTEDDQRDTN